MFGDRSGLFSFGGSTPQALSSSQAKRVASAASAFGSLPALPTRAQQLAAAGFNSKNLSSYGGVEGINPPETDAQRRAAIAAAKKHAREVAAAAKAAARTQAKALRDAATEIQLAYKRAASKARLTTGLGDNVAAATRQVAAFQRLHDLHKKDVSIQRDLVNAQTQLNSLREKEKSLLQSAVSNAQQSFGDYGAGPSGFQTAQALGFPTVAPEKLLKGQQAQLSFFLKGQAALEKLTKRGAPAGLVTQLRGQGETGEVLAESLANASGKTLRQIFATFKAGQKAVQHAAHVAIQTPKVTLSANRVDFAATAAAGHGGAPINIHVNGARDQFATAKAVANELTRLGKGATAQTRGKNPGHNPAHGLA